MKYSEWRLLPSETTNGNIDLGLPTVESALLFHRGITTKKDAESFLNPSSSSLNDPYLLPGMTACVSRLQLALKNNEYIGIFGDFDTDGITGTVVLSKGLRDLGGIVFPYVPHRVQEGHGISSESIEFFKDKNVTLLVTVDCGVTSFEEISLAGDAGIQTIVTDHHSPSERLPNAVAIVNPALRDSNYPFDGLTGVGTAFKVIEALFQTYEKSVPEYLYALVALGTISDVGRMRDENRYLARKGIAVMKSLQMPGIDSLIRKAGFSKNRISSENLSFGIIPRINVAGRLEHADLSLRLLMSTDSEESAAIANKLEYLNKKRQVITEKAVSEARNQLIRNNPEKIPSMIFSGSKTWPAGILGLVAGRLSEEYHRPVIAVSGVGEYLRASARSIPEFNMIEALRTCESVFEKYGGHPMAAGFTIQKDNLREFRQQMSSIADELLGQLCIGSVLEIEHEITPGWLNSESLKFLSDLEPYGDGNAAPVFMTTGVNVLDARAVGKERDHLKLTVEHKGNLFDAIAFRQGNRLKEARGDLDIAYTGGVNYWKGRESVQLTVQDFRKSNQASGSF